MDFNTILPGPIDASVLTLQDDHRSRDVWDGIEGFDTPFVCREHHSSIRRHYTWRNDPRILAHVDTAGLRHIHELVDGGIEIDRALVTALVERWRQETHTFHLAVGEATITLQDVALILGLRIDGPAVIGRGDLDWYSLITQLLGVPPDNELGDDGRRVGPKVLSGMSLRLSWLRRTFSDPPHADADDVVVLRYARAYMLALLGSFLFPDKSGDTLSLYYLPLLNDLEAAGRLSWGSATLAFLYRQLCLASKKGARELGGCLILLQIWSWEHIHIGRPAIVGPLEPEPYGPLVEGDEYPHVLGSQHTYGHDSLSVRYVYL